MSCSESKKSKILIGSAVYQKKEILEVFLQSLALQHTHTITIDYMFIDDNVDPECSNLLKGFTQPDSTVTILSAKNNDTYLCDDYTHHWNKNLILKVAEFKNRIISHAIENDYDYLFLIDSDMIIVPNLIELLKSKNKEIISEIFWSNWAPDKPVEPSAWMYDEYDLVPREYGEELTPEESKIRETKFINMLKLPGTYEVGGLCACTLFSRSALLKGVDFTPIKNLMIWGEDRFLCIRAAVNNVDLFMDTHYPTYHIYRDSDLAGGEEYLKKATKLASFKKTYSSKNKITLSMIVKNEEKRYLREMLESVRDHIHKAVIVNDSSTDGTAELCREMLKDIPLLLISNKNSMFSQENSLRKKLWQETINTNPDWILALDADEIIEPSFWENSNMLFSEKNNDLIALKLYDMWDETHYREDQHWDAHRQNKTVFLRFQSKFSYQWSDTPQHCGRFPINLFEFNQLNTNYGIQHFGWATKADREEKSKRYKKLDPHAIYGNREQYESILTLNPNLLTWKSSGKHDQK